MGVNTRNNDEVGQLNVKPGTSELLVQVLDFTKATIKPWSQEQHRKIPRELRFGVI